jgi:hypothetical protein
MYIETYVLSFAVWLLITRTSLGMSRFLKLLVTSWFAVVVVAHIFSYTQNHDWRHLVQSGIWIVIALNTYFAKPIDKRGFWRDLRETAFPIFDAILLVGFLFGLAGIYGKASALQMTQPIVEKVMTAEGAKGFEEVAERLASVCPSGTYTDTLWSGKLYLSCDNIHGWSEVTSVYLSVSAGPDKERIASAVVGFDNQTGEIRFINRSRS